MQFLLPNEEEDTENATEMSLDDENQNGTSRVHFRGEAITYLYR